MSELFKNIIPGQRYLFYQKDLGNDNKIVKFRADFIDIINSTLRLTKFYCEERKVFINSRLLTMPLGWIVKIESLEDICINSSAGIGKNSSLDLLEVFVFLSNSNTFETGIQNQVLKSLSSLEIAYHI